MAHIKNSTSYEEEESKFIRFFIYTYALFTQNKKYKYKTVEFFHIIYK